MRPRARLGELGHERGTDQLPGLLVYRTPDIHQALPDLPDVLRRARGTTVASQQPQFPQDRINLVFEHPAVAEALSVPARRPIKPIYVRRFVRLIETVRGDDG